MDNDLTIQLKVLSTGVDQINKATQAVNNLDKSTKNTSKGFTDFGNKMKSAGSQLNVLGQRMTWMVTVPLVAFANKSIETALEVEKSWLRMQKVFDGTESELSDLKKVAWDIATTYGISFEEAADAMTEFSKAGIKGKEELDGLARTTAKVAILFDSDMSQALTGVKAIMFGYGLTVEQTAQELDAINIIADKTTASEKGVMEMLSKVSGTARAAGFSIREVAAAQAVFEANAIPAGRAGNAMKSILTSLTKQSNLAKDQFADLGVSMTSLEWKTSSGSEKLEKLAKKLAELKSVGDKKVLQKFNDQLGEMSKSIGDDSEGPIQKLQLLKAAIIEAEKTGDQVKLDAINKELNGLNVAGDNSSEKIKTLETNLAALESTGRTVELYQANEALASLVGKFQINNLNVLLEDLSKNFDEDASSSSIFAEAMNVSNDEIANAQWGMEQLNKVMDSNVVKVAALEQKYREQAAILGEQLLPYKIKLMEILIVLIDKFNNLSPSMQSLIINLGVIVAILGPLLMLFGLLVTAAGFIVTAINPVTLTLVALIATVGLLSLAWTKNWGGIQEKTKAVMEAIVGFYNTYLKPLWDRVNEDNAWVYKFWTDNWENIKTFFKGIWDAIVGIYQVKWAVLKGAIKIALSVLSGDWGKAWEDMKEMFSEAMEGTKKTWDGAWSAMKSGFSIAVDYIMGRIDALIEKIKDLIDKAKELGGKVADKLGFNMGGIVGKFNKGGVVYAANGFFPKGKDTVPAMLSPGEMVLNQGQQSRLFDILAGKTQLAGGGGPVININVGNMIASRGEQREFARMIKERLAEDSNRY